MSNVFASAIFCARNTKKAENGDLGRVPVAIGQGKNVFNSIVNLENSVGKSAKSAVDAFQKVSKEKPIFGYMGKGVDLASKYVNPLICVSAGLKVLTSDDKVTAGLQQGLTLSSMFAVESLMKSHLDKVAEIKGIDKIAKQVVEFSAKTPGFKALPAIIKGVAFVGGSIGGFMIGEKAGTSLAQTFTA